MKEIVANYIDRLWNEKDLSVIDEVFAPNAKLRSPLGTFDSPAGMKQIVETWLKRVPNMRVEQLHLVEEGDVVISHWRTTGDDMDYQGVTVHRLEGGQIVEYWAYTDRV
ncbi:MAG: hypothetical protein S4CHLAM81_10970 [Chlamydiales bacterium]|nr:hypothetical protein [Chlamydiales bacterium]MCH9635875.1 hypothetical protein [Chlamydiales bacterium]MCH9704391.1 nuclear transport factor 2 family protein [Chlamydiota bacterium]